MAHILKHPYFTFSHPSLPSFNINKKQFNLKRQCILPQVHHNSSEKKKIFYQTPFKHSIHHHNVHIHFNNHTKFQIITHALPDEKNVSGVKEGWARTLLLGLLFAGWYGANIFFNIYNKQVLKVYPYPITCTCLQFFVGSAMVGLCCILKIIQLPKINKQIILRILPLAIVHTLGNLFTNVSLGRVAVSFTHTIKALEPFFSVILSSVFLNSKPSLLVFLSLFPIVGGVATASLSEATFNWPGFLSAMGSNLSFQSRNVLSKKTMGDTSVKIDNMALFSIITLFSSLILFPFTILIEGFTFNPSTMRTLGVLDPMNIIYQAIMAGVLFHTYQQISYMILERVTPVTHSIGNCVKRVIVIVASVIVFQNPMSNQNKIGTAIALAGVFLYSQAKRISKDKKN